MAIRIENAKESDYGEILSLYASALESTKKNPTSTDPFLSILEKGLGEETVYVARENRKILGFVRISREATESLYPESKSYGKTMNLLDDLNIGLEEVIVVKGVYVDPLRQNQGVGTELLRSLYARFKEASFLLLLSPEQKRLRSFFSHRGFAYACPFTLEGDPNEKDLLLRKYKPSGLCREAKW
ncbi:MAG: GNAT family N-acetyltransferase [Erysipelotrichaceae bacterium]|nr:GNAT family N-acetyltransferase [Erysipelotrichaceae bacterium]